MNVSYNFVLFHIYSNISIEYMYIYTWILVDYCCNIQWAVFHLYSGRE